MEFTGRISKVLPLRQGVSKRTGSEWKALPFIFEYYENDTDRYSDKVMLETFDTNLIPQIRENAKVRVGFGHSVRDYTNPQGVTQTYNELRLYKMEILDAPVGMQDPATPKQPETPQYVQPTQESGDTLPF